MSDGERLYVVDRAPLRYGPTPLIVYRAKEETGSYTPLDWVFYQHVSMFEPKAGCLDA